MYQKVEEREGLFVPLLKTKDLGLCDLGSFPTGELVHLLAAMAGLANVVAAATAGCRMQLCRAAAAIVPAPRQMADMLASLPLPCLQPGWQLSHTTWHVWCSFMRSDQAPTCVSTAACTTPLKHTL